MERFVVAEETATGEVVGFGQLKEWPCLADRQDLAGQVVRTAGLTPNWEVRRRPVPLYQLLLLADLRQINCSHQAAVAS
jgi:hypothetical protein